MSTDERSSPPDAGPVSTARVRPFQLISLIVGWAIIVFALHGMVRNRSSNPPHLLRLLISLNVVNDALVIPVVLGVSLLVRRLLPSWAVVAAQVGLFTSAIVVLYAYPLLGDWGRTARAGFSRLPYDYAHNVWWVLGAIWHVCGVLAVWQWRRRSAGY